VCHGPNRPSYAVGLPWDEHAVSDGIGGHSEEVKKGLGDEIELRAATVQTGAAGAKEPEGFFSPDISRSYRRWQPIDTSALLPRPAPQGGCLCYRLRST
jgi:hypothetical protein